MRKTLAFLFFLIPLVSFSQLSVVELEAKRVPEPISRDTEVDRWNLSQPGYPLLPKEAKDLLYWTNYSRNNPKKFWDSAVTPILALFPSLNKQEARSLELTLSRIGPLPMFTLNAQLVKTAQSHAADIAGKNARPSHSSTNGADFGTRMKLAGIRRCANENISLSSQSILLSVVLLYLDIGLPELGHRKTLLDANLREIGVGSALYGKDQWFLVQDFACQQ
jgi:hypothetical protein